jgi:hypothetical protein
MFDTLAQVTPLLHVIDVEGSPVQVKPGILLRPAQETPVQVIVEEELPSLQA